MDPVIDIRYPQDVDYALNLIAKNIQLLIDEINSLKDVGLDQSQRKAVLHHLDAIRDYCVALPANLAKPRTLKEPTNLPRTFPNQLPTPPKF